MADKAYSTFKIDVKKVQCHIKLQKGKKIIIKKDLQALIFISVRLHKNKCMV